MGDAKPPHYTFVFPFVLTKNQRDFWRDTFLPEQRGLYPELKTLDYVDNLAQLLEDKPEIVNLLTDGAYGEYFRETIRQTATTGVSPVATAADLTTDPIKMAERARAIGEGDPHFSYRLGGREARSEDVEITESGRRFTMNHAVGNLPNFSMEIRQGDAVAELHANVRPEAEIEAPELWFEESEEGEQAYLDARISLSRGVPIEFSGDAVGVKPRVIPDRFRDELSEEGLLRHGTVRLGLSESIDLSIELTLRDSVVAETICLYRIPTKVPCLAAYGGNYHGVLIILDFEPLSGADMESDNIPVEMHLALMLAVGGVRSSDAINGLGFSQALEKASEIRMECPTLLPQGGIAFTFDKGKAANQDAWNAATVIAVALTTLEDRDGQLRMMPSAAGLSDFYAAQMVIQVLANGRLAIPVNKEFDLPVDAQEIEGKELEELLDVEVEMPPIADHPTGVEARRQLLDLKPVRIIRTENGAVRLRLHPTGDSAEIVITLPEK